MNKSGRFATLLQMLTAWAGLFVLVLIVAELHNTNMNLEAITRASLTSNRLSHNDRFMNPDISRLVAKIRVDDALSDEDRLQYRRLLRAALISWELEYLAYKNDRVDWLPIDGYRTAMNSMPNMRESWGNWKNAFHPDFVQFMDEQVDSDL